MVEDPAVFFLVYKTFIYLFTHQALVRGEVDLKHDWVTFRSSSYLDSKVDFEKIAKRKAFLITKLSNIYSWMACKHFPRMPPLRIRNELMSEGEKVTCLLIGWRN